MGADKVYTSAEFKRERDNFQALCKDLERTEVKKWLNQILEILMAERAKSQQETENEKLSVLIKKHEELIPSVQKTSVMVDLYWKCYAYGDELKLLQDTKEAWVGYAENNETIAAQFEVAEEEIKLVKKRYNLEDALSDMKKRQDLYNKSNDTISGLFKAINDNFTCMSITLPEDKKKIVDKEIKAALLPQGDKVDKDAQAFKNELNRITDYVTKLAADTKIECDKYSNDVKFWAEYRTGIKEYSPWLAGAEKAAAEGLSKPSDLTEVKALNEKVQTFDKTCLTYAKVLDAANGAAQKMTTHGEADAEVAALKERYNKVKAVSDEWVKKVDILLKEWTLLDNTVTELNSWVAKDKSSEGENQFSLEKMESTLGELKNIFKEKEKLVEGL